MMNGVRLQKWEGLFNSAAQESSGPGGSMPESRPDTSRRWLVFSALNSSYPEGEPLAEVMATSRAKVAELIAGSLPPEQLTYIKDGKERELDVRAVIIVPEGWENDPNYWRSAEQQDRLADNF